MARSVGFGAVDVTDIDAGVTGTSDKKKSKKCVHITERLSSSSLSPKGLRPDSVDHVDRTLRTDLASSSESLSSGPEMALFEGH